MGSVESQLEKAVKRKPLGVLFFPDDFSDLASSDAVRKELDRLGDKGAISKVAQGTCAKPKKSKLIGQVMP